MERVEAHLFFVHMFWRSACGIWGFVLASKMFVFSLVMGLKWVYHVTVGMDRYRY